MTRPTLLVSFRQVSPTVTEWSPSPVKAVVSVAVKTVGLVAVEAAVEAAGNAAVNVVGLVAVKAVVKVAVVGVVGEKPTQNKRTGPKEPLLEKGITMMIPRCKEQ